MGGGACRPHQEGARTPSGQSDRRSRLPGSLPLTLAAALISTPPLALYTALLLARWLPVSEEARAALGLLLPLPLYVVFACVVMRLRAGPAWATCVLLGLAVAVAAGG